MRSPDDSRSIAFSIRAVDATALDRALNAPTFVFIEVITLPLNCYVHVLSRSYNDAF